MSRFEDFIGKFDTKQKKELQFASDVKVEILPLASRTLTKALGGGIRRGTITTIYGNPSAGKSMLAMQSIGMWQKQGLVCGYIDVEQTFDPKFAEKLGVNVDELVVSGSKSGARVTNTATDWLEKDIDIIVIDSVSDILPEVFVDKDGTVKDAEDTKQIGAHAKAITGMINSIHYANNQTAVILLSQTTTKIENAYVQQIPHGGKKIEFGSSQMIQLTSSPTDAKQIKGLHRDGDILVERAIGRHVTASVKKNKVGPQSGTAEYDIYYGGDNLGIDSIGELFDLAVDALAIVKSGAWYNYGDIKWQGRPSALDAIRENPELEKELEQAIGRQEE